MKFLPSTDFWPLQNCFLQDQSSQYMRCLVTKQLVSNLKQKRNFKKIVLYFSFVFLSHKAIPICTKKDQLQDNLPNLPDSAQAVEIIDPVERMSIGGESLITWRPESVIEVLSEMWIKCSGGKSLSTPHNFEIGIYHRLVPTLAAVSLWRRVAWPPCHSSDPDEYQLAHSRPRSSF